MTQKRQCLFTKLEKLKMSWELSEQCFCPSNKQTNSITSIMPVGESLAVFKCLQDYILCISRSGGRI